MGDCQGLTTIPYMYSPEVLDHFERPRNAGQVRDADARVRLENPACGDVVELSAAVGGGKIVEIRFLAKGCVCAVACASALTEMVSGKSVEEAAQVSREELVRKVGGLPAASEHAGHLAIDALRELVRKLT
jgi:nitrogen fixation protein NifU and related proteins